MNKLKFVFDLISKPQVKMSSMNQLGIYFPYQKVQFIFGIILNYLSVQFHLRLFRDFPVSIFQAFLTPNLPQHTRPKNGTFPW